MKITHQKTSELFPYINNAREHSESQVTQIASSIREFGFTNPLLIDDDGGIIAGHGRLMAAKKLEMDEVPCIVLSGLSEAKKKALILADNKLALNATWDEELLKLELESLAEMDVDIGLTGFSSDELDDLLDEFNQEELPDDIDDVPEVETPVSKLGDIWLLGKHRLMCGDSTDEECVKVLMDGNKVDMVFTDPPYGVEYVSNRRNVKHKPIQNDNKIENFFTTLKKSGSLAEDCHFFVFCSYQVIDLWVELAKKEIKYKNLIVWVKNNWSMGDLKGSFACQHEFIIYGNQGKTEISGKRDTDVWNFDKCASKEHPTIKPVDLIVYALKKTNPIKVVDLFGGSGSTLIACEQSNRQCYMMELDAGYMDVIINRWQNLTKQQAIHVQSGMTYEERQLQLGGD